MAHRADLDTLSAGDRQFLVNLMLPYLTDAVVAAHVNIIHSGLELFTGHRAYIADLESHLSANGGAGFVPLPMWDPAKPIPPEFNVVKPQDDSTPRPPLINLNPNMPLPPQWDYPAVCEFDTGADLGNAINGWHGGVHGAIGGTMGSLPIASAAPIFWCWHAFVDHIYWNWQLCQVTCPDLTGCALPYAKLKLRQHGLTCGSITHVPRYMVPPDRVPPRYVPAAERYVQPTPVPQPPPEEYEYAGFSPVTQTGHRVKPKPEPYGTVPLGSTPTHSVAGGPHHEHGGGEHELGGGEHEHGAGGHGHGNGTDHPTPDYSRLMRGPAVLSQYPPAGTSACVKSKVDLVVVID